MIDGELTMTHIRTLPPAALVKKLAEVMLAVDRIAKRGRNDFHKYDYVTEADIADAFRQEMGKRSIIMFPSVEKEEFREIPTRSGSQFLCTLHVRFTVIDGDTGESLSFVVVGQGTDSGDKASYKALTGATKYAIMKLFLVPTGDDPEHEEQPQKRRQRAEPSRGEPPASNDIEKLINQKTTQADMEKLLPDLDAMPEGPSKDKARTVYKNRWNFLGQKGKAA